MAGSLDDLMRDAEQGKAVGRTQRYFKPGAPQPAPAAPQAPATPADPNRPSFMLPGETEEEMINRILGRGKKSMAPGPMVAQASLANLVDRPLSGWTGRPEDAVTYRELLQRAAPQVPKEPLPDPGAVVQQQFLQHGPAVNQRLKRLFQQ